MRRMAWVMCVLVLCMVLGGCPSKPNQVTVPDVVGQPQAAAGTAITGANLTVGVVTEEYSTTVATGLVISQNPAAGTSVSSGSAVALTVSKGPQPAGTVIVPNVVGQTRVAASAAITGADLVVGAVTQAYSATVAVGTVVSQTPAAGAAATPGTSVNIVVSLGAASGDSLTKLQGIWFCDDTGYDRWLTITGDSIKLQDYLFLLGPSSSGPFELEGTIKNVDNSGVIGKFDLYWGDMNGSPVTSYPIYDCEENDLFIGSDDSFVLGAGFGVGPRPADFSFAKVNRHYVRRTEKTQYPKLTVTTEGQGTVALGGSADSGDVFVPGTKVSLTAAPVEHWALDHWEGDVTGNANHVSVTMDTDKKVTAVFMQGLEVPDVVGMTQAEAQAAIELAGFSVGAVTQQCGNAAAAGLVMVQEPQAGQWAVPGRVATLVVLSPEPCDGTKETVMLPGKVFLEMIGIPEGTFTMGSPDNEQNRRTSEGPQHSVTLTGFWMAKYELTKRQWTAVMGTTPWSTLEQRFLLNDPDSPAIQVSWNDAKLFLTALNGYTGETFRLPSEAEWEYACRAGSTSTAPPGMGGWDAWAASDGFSNNYTWYARVVGQRSPNVWGLYDMIGNASEWCEDDWHDSYAGAPTRGQAWVDDPRSGEHVCRGGSVSTLMSSDWRSAFRGIPGVGAQSDIGFRIARTLPENLQSVPNVVGLTQAAASTAIMGAGLTVGAVTEEYSETVASGSVISQNPTAGTSVDSGTIVVLTVSKGPEPVSVPNVVGQTQTVASTAITGAGLTVGTVTEEYSDTIPSGAVSSTTPASGLSVVPGTAVNLVVSKGPEPEPVPDVVGQTQAAASSAITGANLTVGVITQECSDTVTPGCVVIQNPVAGAQGVVPGSAVAVAICTGRCNSATEETVLLPGSVPLTMVWIPGGTFLMGRTPGEQGSYPPEDPQHEVTLGGYWMAKYELTKRQWTAVMGTTPWAGQGSVLADLDSPAVFVSWDDAQSFLTAANSYTGKTFRLPSEAQWEHASRAGTQTRFYWGDDPTHTAINDYAWWSGNAEDIGMGKNSTRVVGLKLPNAWGLYDMSGNAEEWCEDDWHNDYTGAPTGGQAWVESPRGSYRLLRGGSWNSYDFYCRSAYRHYYYYVWPDFARTCIGFRVAWTP